MASATRRTVELATASGVVLFGILVAVDSLPHDVGWNPNGPAAGYFPFRVGLLLLAAGCVIFARARRESSTHVFVTDEQWRRTFGVFWPIVVLILLMFVLGCYLPSAMYLAWMIWRYGGYGPARAVCYAVALVLILFGIFELWLRVHLGRGPVVAAFGIYCRVSSMTELSSLLGGFQAAFTAYHVALMIGGVLIGILVGVLPGLGAPNGVTLLLPLTFSMEPISAIIMLSSMYW